MPRLTGSIFTAVCNLTTATAMLAAFGCASPESAQRHGQHAEATTQESAEIPGASAGSELASLAQRDVQAFLNRQRPSESAAVEESPKPARKILWNEPKLRPEPDTKADPFDIDLPDVRPSRLFLLSDESGAEEGKPVAEPKGESTPAIERDRIRELIVELSKELYREASYGDMPLRELMLIAATTIITPDRALEPEAIPALTTRERQVLARFQEFFTHIGQQLDGSRTADEALLHAVDELRAALSTEPELHLDTMALCTRVGGFGDYDPFDRYSFLAHAEQQAVLYLELAGFTSELNQKNQWVTELSLQLMIYSDRDGIPVWREDWQTAVDVSRNKRQDFFMVQILTLPKALSVGRYHLKVRVRDEKSRAEAEGAIPIEMVADPKLAAGTTKSR